LKVLTIAGGRAYRKDSRRCALARNVAEDLAILGSAVLRTSANNALTGRGVADINGALTPNPLK
jgi:hypothetical protein